MTCLLRFRGLAFIALWQVAPVTVHQDSSGRVQIHFAGGAGRYEEVTTSCDGELLGTEDFGYSGGGVAVEAWPADWARLNAFAGLTDSESPDFSSLNVGVLGALEWRSLGVGAGVAALPGEGETIFRDSGGVTYSAYDPTQYLPIIYARVGNIDALHLRLESSSAQGLDRMGGMLRLGFGYNQGLLRGSRIYAGVAMCHADCEGEDETAVLFLDLSRPIAERFDIRVGGVYGPGEANPEYGFTIGGSWLPMATRTAIPEVVPAPSNAPDGGIR